MHFLILSASLWLSPNFCSTHSLKLVSVLIGKYIFGAGLVVLLTACQTAENQISSSTEDKPTIVTGNSIPEAKVLAKAVFTHPANGFYVVSETRTQLLFTDAAPAAVTGANTKKGGTETQVQLTFQTEGALVRVTGDVWMYKKSRGAAWRRQSLLGTSHSERLQLLLEEIL